MLGQAAIPTGLILAGVGLSFGYMVEKPWLVGFVSGFKVVILPILSLGICILLGGDKTAQAIALACGATPSAAAGLRHGASTWAVMRR